MTLVRRGSTVLVLVFVVAAFTTCAAHVGTKGLRCPVAQGPYAYSAQVEVVGGEAVVYPERIPVHARWEIGGKRTASEIRWFAPGSGSNLRVEMKDPAQQCVVEPIDCLSRPGTCIAKTNADFNGDAPVECGYRVWIEGQTQKPHDPIIIVDNCCSG